MIYVFCFKVNDIQRPHQYEAAVKAKESAREDIQVDCNHTIMLMYYVIKNPSCHIFHAIYLLFSIYNLFFKYVFVITNSILVSKADLIEF